MTRVWFVTGFSRGLGRVLVEKVLESGDIVVATARKSTSTFSALPMLQRPLCLSCANRHLVILSQYLQWEAESWAVGGFLTVVSKEVAPFGIRVTVAEPTGINTNMGATATGNSKVSESYEQTVSQMIQLISKEYSGWTEVSEIARAIIHLSNVENPPLRIVLGKDALQEAEMVAKALADSDKKWANVSKLEC
ncbi:hypothetical protein FOMG_17310 [Fusarium oxysporum f. sp. melonis 26406]|uniref:Uncharacterized protein n=1 Tax=Fusarium oxysporum f. sp. melonis 26406 TaxID=1089452 RepID=W9Z401_FUSOX|nr:hypothetical protein FOMG_17310 [Fusarium oxysporum f. sp. melonis 26406]